MSFNSMVRGRIDAAGSPHTISWCGEGGATLRLDWGAVPEAWLEIDVAALHAFVQAQKKEACKRNPEDDQDDQDDQDVHPRRRARQERHTTLEDVREYLEQTS